MFKRIIACLGLLYFASTSFSATLSEIRSDVRYSIRDTTATTNNYKYSDVFLNYRINQTAQEIARATLPIYTSKLISTVTGQMEYTVSTDTAKIDRVCMWQTVSTTDNYKKLTFATLSNLDDRKGSTWESSGAGNPTDYYVRGNIVGLVPKPDGAHSFTNALKVYYYKIPIDMCSDSAEPWEGIYNLKDYHSLIVIGVTYKCKKDVGDQTWKDDYTTFLSGLARMQTDLNTVRPDSQVIPIVRP